MGRGFPRRRTSIIPSGWPTCFGFESGPGPRPPLTPRGRGFDLPDPPWPGPPTPPCPPLRKGGTACLSPPLTKAVSSWSSLILRLQQVASTVVVYGAVNNEETPPRK